MFTLPLADLASEIGTDAFPLRPSALPKLLECPASVFMASEFWNKADKDDEDGGGEAADTGSLMHAGAAEYHRQKMQDSSVSQESRVEAGKEAMLASRDKFPDANEKRATEIYNAYVKDKTNQVATLVRVEEKVRIEIPPVDFDPTGKPIVIRGMLDQIRQMPDGALRVMDIKTGRKFYGELALHHYMTQQAAYTLGAIQTWPEYKSAMIVGGLICTDGYFRKGGKQYWWNSWSIDDIPDLLYGVAVQVAVARGGRMIFQPGEACRWCEYGSLSHCRAIYKHHTGER